MSYKTILVHVDGSRHAEARIALAVRLAAAHGAHHVEMDRLPAQIVDAKLALKQMPPLIKGYLRLGARFGTGAVVDRQFGTTDVLVILPVAAIDQRYVAYYGDEGQRYAA